MMDVTLRLAAAGDATAVRALADRLAEFDLPPWRTPGSIAAADAAAMLASIDARSDDDQVFIAEREGVAVGCVHVLADTDFFGVRHAHISVLAVSRAAEGTGVGRLLMTRAEEWTAARGLTLLTLNVFAHNGRARRFYEMAGFEPEMVKYARDIKR
jgi:ribosomal protein S18 acetylase RimI-like enzyme